MLTIVILSQNPKGGGLDPTFGASGANQIFGAAKSADFVEKIKHGISLSHFLLFVLRPLF
jgi:preprotein translocase subunit SecG